MLLVIAVAHVVAQTSETVCGNSCTYSDNGLCQDGGGGHIGDSCDLGEDCSDCACAALDPGASNNLAT